MDKTLRMALLISVAMIITGFLIGGRFSVSLTKDGYLYIIDKYTGSGRFCLGKSCYSMKSGK